MSQLSENIPELILPDTFVLLALTLNTHEQRHFYANKAKTGARHFWLKRYKTRYRPVKRERIRNSRNAQHPEQDQNEIETRYEFAQYEAIKGRDRVARLH